MSGSSSLPALAARVLALVVLFAATSIAGQRTFDSPDAAAQALMDVAKGGKLDALLDLLGPGGRELAASSDPETARQNREVFVAAAREHWHLEEDGADKRTLLIGHEDWPFPVPIVRGPMGWRFDAVAGREEVLARRVGRNELATLDICRAYVTAQQRYAADAHDGRPAGVYAQAFASEPGRQNGLYWPTSHGQKRSPLGSLVAAAASEGRSMNVSGAKPTPFHGYYFRILTRQGASAPGGARSYIVGGAMSGGFALIAWPAVYDASGVMTFVVNQDGVIHEKDLGPKTDALARGMKAYDPDASWQIVR
jgi:Protein of unknown function (DUF2950)